MMPAPPALMRVFQTMACQLGQRFGIQEVHALQGIGPDGPRYYCQYRLAPTLLRDSDGWDESCEADSIEDALDNLHYALRERAATSFFSVH